MQNKIIIYLDNKEEPIGEFMSADITLENKEKIKEEILSILSEKLGVSIESITIEPAAMYNGSNRVIIKTIECNDKQSFKYTYKFKIYKSSPARVPTNKTKEKLESARITIESAYGISWNTVEVHTDTIDSFKKDVERIIEKQLKIKSGTVKLDKKYTSSRNKVQVLINRSNENQKEYEYTFKIQRQ